MAFWKRKRKEMDIPPPPSKPRISIPSDLPSFPSSREERLPPLPPLKKKPEPPIFHEEAERLPPLPKMESLKFEPLPPLPPLEPEKEIKKAVEENLRITEPIAKPGPGLFRPEQRTAKPAPGPYLFRPLQPAARPHFFQPQEMPKPVIRQAVEETLPKRERPEVRKIKRGLLRGRELFIEVDDFRIMFEILDGLKKNISEISGSIGKIEEAYGNESELFEKWQKSQDMAQKKIMSIDKSLFK